MVMVVAAVGAGPQDLEIRQLGESDEAFLVVHLLVDVHDAMGANAGIDLFMVSETWREFIAAMLANVERGAVPIARIDDAVRRILKVKLAWGLFDRPRPAERPLSNHASFGCAEHRLVAREAVRKSLVLLKNNDQVLPLARDARILVAGKSADNAGYQCGGFTVDWQGLDGNERVVGGTSIWEGIRQVAPNAELSRDPLASEADPERHNEKQRYRDPVKR